MEPNSELIIGPAKRGPSSPKIIVDSNLTVQNSSAIRPTPLKAGKTITHLDSSSPSQVKIQAYLKKLRFEIKIKIPPGQIQ